MESGCPTLLLLHPREQLSPRQGDLQLACKHRPVTSADPKSSFFLYPSFHSLHRGLPTTRALFTCQKRPVTAKLPTMSFGGSACQWCLGHSRRGSAAKTWQLLKRDSLGSFKMPLSVTSGMFNNRSSHQCVQTWGFFLLNIFFKAQLVCLLSDAENHGWLLTGKCKSFIKTASASASIPSPDHPSPLLFPSGF